MYLFFFFLFFFLLYGDHLDLHVLTPSFPTRRSSDLREDGAVLVAVTITGQFTLWKYVDSDYSWHLSVVVELCPPTAMVTDVAYDSTTGLLFWSERQDRKSTRLNSSH